jgi:hypothetical protein
MYRTAFRHVGLSVALALTTSGFAQSTPQFDLDTGNAATDVVIPTVVPTIVQNIGAGDASLTLYTTSTTVASWFDAIAPYSATAVGVFSPGIPRRPLSEGLNNRNRNIALLHASLRTLSATHPKYVRTWRKMVQNAGLNPDNDSEDPATPEGIGNIAGKAVVQGRKNDGFNRDGDRHGRKYNLHPYEDYTGYEPVNSASKLVDPSRWQPKIVSRSPGVFRSQTNPLNPADPQGLEAATIRPEVGLFEVQRFVTPQWGRTRAFSYEDVDQFIAPPPTASQQVQAGGYMAQADEVLRASANLTDEQKMIAELFNDKFASLGRATNHIREKYSFDMERYVQYNFTVQIAAHDGGIATWKEKARYDSVRPFSAIRFLYGDKNVTAWGGPGKGTVGNISGNEWESYLPVADHPDYPSGSACFCAAHAQASRRFLAELNLAPDDFGWTVQRARGSSVVEPGVTPVTNISITFPTFTDFTNKCAESRVHAGVHFRSAIEEGRKLCQPIGDLAFEFVNRHVLGRPAPGDEY